MVAWVPAHLGEQAVREEALALDHLADRLLPLQLLGSSSDDVLVVLFYDLRDLRRPQLVKGGPRDSSA
jgi:hypothetical protein